MDPNQFEFNIIGPDYKILKELAEQTGLDVGLLAQVSLGLAAQMVYLVKLTPKQSVLEQVQNGNTINAESIGTTESGTTSSVSHAGTGV
jgi:hypothetical protein